MRVLASGARACSVLLEHLECRLRRQSPGAIAGLGVQSSFRPLLLYMSHVPYLVATFASREWVLCPPHRYMCTCPCTHPHHKPVRSTSIISCVCVCDSACDDDGSSRPSLRPFSLFTRRSPDSAQPREGEKQWYERALLSALTAWAGRRLGDAERAEEAPRVFCCLRAARMATLPARAGARRRAPRTREPKKLYSSAHRRALAHRCVSLTSDALSRLHAADVGLRLHQR